MKVNRVKPIKVEAVEVQVMVVHLVLVVVKE